MPIISQNLTVPSTLGPGQVARSQDIITLYNTFNAFNVPDTIGVFQQALIDDTLTTLTIGGTVTKDWAFTVAKTKAILFVVSFAWSTSGATVQPSLTFRVNGSNVTAAALLANAGTGNGMIRWWIGPHDTDVPRPSMITIFDGSGVTNVQLNADLPNADTTSVGLTFGNASSGSLKLKYMRAWKEG